MIREQWQQLEQQVAGPFFQGLEFIMVDAAYAPVFRYFDVLDDYLPGDLFAGLPHVQQWRLALSQRASTRAAVSPNYPQRLREFLLGRNRYLSSLMATAAARQPDTNEIVNRYL